MSKIITTSSESSEVVIESLPSAPTGYTWLQVDATEWTLTDSYGRICVDIMLRKAYAMRPPTEIDMAWEQWSNRNKPYDWLRTSFGSSFRTLLNDELGYDPVHIERGGDRGKNQVVNSPLGNITSGFWQLRVSTNGNVQTYGTYMDPRLFISFSASTNIPYHRYIIETYMSAEHNPLSANGLVMSTDELYAERDQVRKRNSKVIQATSVTAANLVTPYETATWAMVDYNAMLRSDYNINTSTGSLLKWMVYNGLFNIAYINVGSGQYDAYQPREEYCKYVGDTPPLFIVNYTMIDAVMIPNATITTHGHNSLIQALVNSFGSIGT